MKNKYQNYQIEDLMMDESFLKWLDNPRDSFWNDLLEENTELKSKAEVARQMILKMRSQFARQVVDDRRIESLKTKIDLRIDSMTTGNQFKNYHVHGKKKMAKHLIPSIAASLIFIFITIFLIYSFNFNQTNAFNDEGPSNLQEIKSTKNGQKLTVHLSDGSSIKLNSGSKITYEKYFGEHSREVFLEGEAFFDVAKDPLRPFRVHTSTSLTEALGTSFVIKSRSGEQSQVILVTGKLLVKSTIDKSKVILIPGEEVSLNMQGVGKVGYADYAMFSWKDDVLIFNNAGRDEVFDHLELWYGVEFDFHNQKRSDELWNYSGKFESQSLANVLKTIGYAEGFSFAIENKKVVINLNDNSP